MALEQQSECVAKIGGAVLAAGLAMESLAAFPNFIPFFNVAAGKNYSLNQLYSLLQELTGHSGSPAYGVARTGDVHDSLADTSAAQQAMGYSTLVDFKEGLRRTVEWYRAELRQESREISELV